MNRTDQTFRGLGVLTATGVYFLSFFRQFGVNIILTVTVMPADIFIAFAGCVWAYLILRRQRLQISLTVGGVVILIGLLIVYNSLLVFPSPQPIRGFTLILLIVRDIILFMILMTTLDIRTIPIVSRNFYVVAGSISTAMMTVYSFGMAGGVHDAWTVQWDSRE